MNQIVKFFQKKDTLDHRAYHLPDSSLKELLYHAEIGSLAYRIGHHLEKDERVSKEAFFQSLKSCRTTENESDELLSYAKLLYDWIESGEDVNEKLTENHFSIQVEEVMLQTFKEYKNVLKKRKSILGRWEKSKQTDKAKYGSEWKVYRDVMHAATQRKFLLIDEEEAFHFLNKGHILFHGKVRERKDIPTCREAAKESLENASFSSLRLNSLLLVISEATTNIIKHAEEGEVAVTECEDSLHIIVKDKGPGYVLEDLPNTVLMAGYSTKKSLGQGFTLMMKIVDQIQLALTSDGSILVLSFALKEEGNMIHA